MAALNYANTPGNGMGVSGPALAKATPRQMPRALDNDGDSPTTAELRAAWNAYQGIMDEGNRGPLEVQAGVPNLNILSNRIKPIVNTGVDFLFGPMFSFSVEEDDGANKTANEAAQELLDAVWGDDDLRMTLLAKAAINGGVYGHVFMKVVPPKRGTPSAKNPPRLVLLNPEHITVETDPDDADLVMRFCIEYACIDPQTRAPMRKRQEICRVDPDGDDDSTATTMDKDTTWTIQDFEASGQLGNNWVPVVVQGTDAPRPWPYALPPIIDWQNYPNPNAHWGQRDVTDSLVALNKQLRLVESNINKVGFLQGHPILYSDGPSTQGIRPTPGQIIDLEVQGAKIEAVNASGNLQQLMDFADAVRGDMDEESGMPGVALGRMKDLPRGQISGITMRLLYATPLARNEHKRRLYGQGIRQVCQTILAVCGMPLDAVKALGIKLNWQDPLPNDDFAEAQAWQLKTSTLGYSQTTAIEETGGNPELEAERKQDEQQQQMTAFSQGKGTPPMDMNALAASAQMTGPDESATTAQAGQQQQPAQPQGNMAALNSPKARMARATMKQMANR
jgi:hypothetical protein